jgi:hypothetical protein
MCQKIGGEEENDGKKKTRERMRNKIKNWEEREEMGTRK